MTSTSSFGRWLREQRQQLDMTQDELANQVGCSTITIRKIESEQRKPSRQIAIRLAHCLQVADIELPAFIAFARGKASQAQAALPPTQIAYQIAPLPSALTTLIGREQELNTICQLLYEQAKRLLSIVGPPGIGKTRLSLELANLLRAHFDNHVIFVELAALSDPKLVLSAIALNLGVSESAERPLLGQLVDIFQQPWLIVLDNMEHVLEAAGDIATLLTRCPELYILATSRAALRIRGEQLIHLSPLSVPDASQTHNLMGIASTAAVQLFVERARASNPSFLLNETNAEAIATICRRLDGLPLAIELVSTRTSLLSAQALLKYLNDDPILHLQGQRDLPDRHRTLQSAIDWSHTMLTPDQQRLFRRLGVFVGSWSLEAAQEITSITASAFVDQLMVLVDQSLVRPVPGASPRFTMLETIREYALQLLIEAAEAEHFLDRKAVYYVNQVEQALSYLNTDQQDATLSLLELRHEQYRSVLKYCLKQTTPQPDQPIALPMLGLRLTASLWHFWYTRCHLSEGRQWLQQALTATPDTASPTRVQALLGAGVLAHEQGDYSEAHALLQESMHLAEQLDDQRSIGQIAYHLGRSALSMHDIASGIRYHETCLAIQRSLADQEGIARALNGLGNMLLIAGELERAQMLLDEALGIQRQLRNSRGIAFILHSLGTLDLQRETCSKAEAYFHEALHLFRQLGDTIGIADCLAGLAASAGANQRHVRARRLWANSERLRERIAAPLNAADRALYERHLKNGAS